MKKKPEEFTDEDLFRILEITLFTADTHTGESVLDIFNEIEARTTSNEFTEIFDHFSNVKLGKIEGYTSPWRDDE